MSTNLEARPQVGSAWRVDPVAATITPLAVRSEGQMDLMSAWTGTLLTFHESPIEGPEGLLRWESASNDWVGFAPGLGLGPITALDDVPVAS
jgi:hypothetical protein